MNRTKKNILMVIASILLAGCMVFTAHAAGASLAGDSGMPQMMQGGPAVSQDQSGTDQSDTDNSGADSDSSADDRSDKTGSDSADSDKSGSSSSAQGSNAGQDGAAGQDSGQAAGSDQSSKKGTPPTPPDGNGSNGNGQPPAMPGQGGNGPDGSGSGSSDSGSSDSNANGNGQPPAMPGQDGNGPDGSDSGSSDSGSSDSNANGNGQPPAMPGQDGNGPDGSGNPPGMGSASLRDISAGYYILFGVEGLAFALVLIYLFMSGFHARTLRETFSAGRDKAAAASDRSAEELLLSDSMNYSIEDTEPINGSDPADGTGSTYDTVSEGGSRSVEAGSRTASLSKKKIAAFIVAVLLLGGALIPAQAALATSAFAGGGQKMEQMQGGPGQEADSSSAEATGATTVDGTEETLNDTYTSTNADENAILVTGGGSLTSNGATINKESGDSSNTESSDFSGVNAGLLVQENSTATVKNATIKTSAKGANAVFATGENAKVKISDSTITTTGEASSRGLDATYGGTIEADNVTITTQGGSCAAMATDRGEGTVSATNSTLETNGAGSPVIYSTGDISLTDSEGTANGAQIAVVEGKNSASIENSTVSCSGAGNRGDVDIAGVMIYQSMSGDADEGTGNFTARNSSLCIQKDSNYYKTAPMFFVTNTDAVIDLENTDLSYGSGILLSAQGTSEWGSEGSNGGNVTFTAKEQNLTGDIQLDEISTLDLTLTDSSYKGTINGDNTAKTVSLTLDKDSSITLTGDSYVSSLDDADSSYSNIDFNGYTLYVDGKAIN